MIDLSTIFKSMINASFLIISLLILSRILGKNQINQLTFFNYVTLSVANTINIDIKTIIDGEPSIIIKKAKFKENLVKGNLEKLNSTKDWIKDELMKQGINNYNSVLYAEIQSNNVLYI